MMGAEFLLSYALESDVFLSRLWEVAREVGNEDIFGKNPRWGAQFYARVSLLAGARGWQEMFAEAEQARAWCLYVLGEYADARALEINEALGRQAGVADCLSGLGEVAQALGDLAQAQENLKRATEIIYERIGQHHLAKPIREQLQSMQAQGGEEV